MGIRYLLLEQVADTHCIHALFREFGNLLEGRDILIRVLESLYSRVLVIMIIGDDPP
jgi:hypothetical protein